jgi:hypothetical protein
MIITLHSDISNFTSIRIYFGKSHTKFWYENPKGRNHFGELTFRYNDNIKMNPKEIRCKDMEWIRLPQ